MTQGGSSLHSRTRYFVMLALAWYGLAQPSFGHDATPPGSDVLLWSIAGVQQHGPEDQTFYGARFLYLAFCDDDSCHTPVTFFWGGEVLAAPKGGITRGLASLSILAFAFGPGFTAVPDRHRFSLWVRPTAGLDYAWNIPDHGIGVDAGVGAEFIVRPSVGTQLAVGWERYFSTSLGSRNQWSLAFRWGAH